MGNKMAAMLDFQIPASEMHPCDLCESAPMQSHCEVCNINLCKACVGEHLLDSSKRHNVLPYVQRKSTHSYPKCPKHANELCKHYCEDCDIPVCITCISSGKHKGHKLSEFLEKLSSKTQSLQKDLEELETRICPRYEEMVSNVQTEKAELVTKYGKLTTTADQQGKILHREITAIVKQRKSAIQEMKNKHLSTLNKNAEEITQKITELKQIISDLKSMLKSTDVSLTSTYKSRNSEFRTLPPRVRVTLPSFTPQKINKDQLRELFGSLSRISINTEHGSTMKSPEAVLSPPVKRLKSPEAAMLSPPVKRLKSPEAVLSPPVKQLKSPEAAMLSPPVKRLKSPEAVLSPPVKQLKSPEAAMLSPPVKRLKSPEAVLSPPVKRLKSPEAVLSPPVKPLHAESRLTATIDTGYRELYRVGCLSEDQVWTCGDSKTMKLLNLESKLLTSIKTKSGSKPQDIAVTRDGDLVYTDSDSRTVNLVKNKQIQTLITLQGWRPRNVCSTASGDLLVTMDSDDRKQYKVVRYSGSTEMQTIQFDDQGRPLYSSGDCSTKYISENKNQDICVADYGAKAVVVVNQSGKLRFRYTGHHSSTKKSFNPRGITTDSQSHILTADSGRIHILKQDGKFLRYISCDLHVPWGLCVDIRDDLFVAEYRTAKVKKIQYLRDL